VEVRRQGDRVLLTVSDEGIGMSEEDQAKLFQPYFRAKNVGKIRGTGLGLKITADCVKLHGGTIGVESELGVGTTFRVVIPVADE
jgi:signal transduction histidine kinase